MSIFNDKVKQQLLDGKRSWDIHDTDGDIDRFEIEAVLPLRDLKSLGIVDTIEAEGGRGRKRVVKIVIRGIVRFDKL